jgi:hypothetical protein
MEWIESLDPLAEFMLFQGKEDYDMDKESDEEEPETSMFEKCSMFNRFPIDFRYTFDGASNDFTIDVRLMLKG